MYISRKELERLGEPLGDMTGRKLGKGYICHGGGGKGGDAPATPDYEAAARATAEGNIEAARVAAAANRISQYTPYGNLVYSQDNQGTFDQAAYDAAMANYNRQLQQYNSPQRGTRNAFSPYASGLGSASYARRGARQAPVMPTREQFMTGGNPDAWKATVTLSPEQQAMLEQQNKIGVGLGQSMDKTLQYLNQNLANPIDTANLPANMVNAGQTIQDAIMSRLNPQFEHRQSQLETQLANQGIGRGTEAFTNAQRDLDYARNDAYINAALRGIDEGQQARQQALQEQMSLRNEPINTLSALRTGGQVQNPSFINPAQQATTQGPDILGAQQAGYNANLGAYNAQQAAQNNFTQGLFGLGGSLLGGPIGGGIGTAIGGLFSDERLKTNIKRIGTHDKLGVGIYSYEKFGKPEIGVMAQELQKVLPDAVHKHESGYLMVDYSKV